MTLPQFHPRHSSGREILDLSNIIQLDYMSYKVESTFKNVPDVPSSSKFAACHTNPQQELFVDFQPQVVVPLVLAVFQQPSICVNVDGYLCTALREQRNAATGKLLTLKKHKQKTNLQKLLSETGKCKTEGLKELLLMFNRDRQCRQLCIDKAGTV